MVHTNRGVKDREVGDIMSMLKQRKAKYVKSHL